MSRLYMLLDSLTESEVTPQSVRDVLTAFLYSHQGQSNEASLVIRGDLLLSRKSLNSGQAGWKAYPVSLTARAGRTDELNMKVGIPYASTCPASAALSRQVAQLAFRNDYGQRLNGLPLEEVVSWLGEQGLPATPHSQRSWAWIEVKLKPECPDFPFRHLIDRCELALGTAVQTAVKRSDEQALRSPAART